jgi:hypothetical protein
MYNDVFHRRHLASFQKTHTMKGVGVLEYFLGAACGREKGAFNERGSTSTLLAKTYLQNLIPRLENELGTLRSYTVPMDPEYRPELDETPLLGQESMSKFRMLTGSAQWVITLGRINIGYATTTLSK